MGLLTLFKLDKPYRCRSCEYIVNKMETTESIHKDAWIKDVDSKLSGASYPMDRSVAEQKLKGLNIEGVDATKHFDMIEWPASSREDLVDKFQKAKKGGSVPEHDPAKNTPTRTA
jgi:predicted transcriptional regulator